MSARDLFFEIATVKKQIMEKENQRTKLFSLVTSVTIRTDGDRVQTSGDKDKVGRISVLIADLDREIEDLTKQYEDLQGNACMEIMHLPSVAMYDVIFYRFIEGQTIAETAKIVNKSPARVKQIQHDAMLLLS